MTKHNLSRVLLFAILAIAGFVGLYIFMDLGTLVALLNGVFIGTVAAVCVTYRRLLWHSLTGAKQYDRVEQMTLGLLLCWISYCVAAARTVQFHSAEVTHNAALLAVSRYVAIIAAVLQVTALDFGVGSPHSYSRNAAWAGLAVGVAVSAVVMWLQ